MLKPSDYFHGYKASNAAAQANIPFKYLFNLLQFINNKSHETGMVALACAYLPTDR
ncbi:MAG: hypothetical protein ACKVI8_22500 [Paraglaciecola sp.]